MNEINEERTNFIQGLRDLADYYENNPTMPTPRFGAVYVWCADYSAGRTEEADIKAALVAAAKCPGTWEKEPNEHNFNLKQKFGIVTLIVDCPRSAVCKKVKKMVEAEVWECDPILSNEEFAEMEAGE